MEYAYVYTYVSENDYARMALADVVVVE